MILGGSSSNNNASQNLFPLDDRDLAGTSSSLSKTTASSNERSSVFDPFFGIRVMSPNFSLQIFNIYCGELRKTTMRSLTSSTTKNEAVFMGVIVENTGMRRSSNNKDYLIWHLSDLEGDGKVKVLVFGDAAQAHWKLQPGFVVAITNAEMANDNPAAPTSASSILTFKVNRTVQVLSIGLCPDYGICSGLKKNGERCTNYVNSALSPVCSYHIQAEVRKLRAGRGSLSAVSNERPKCQTFKSPRKSTDGHLFTVNRSKATKRAFKVDFTTADRSAIAAKARLGNRAMMKLDEMRDKENVPSSSPKPVASLQKSTTPKAESSANSLKEFLNKQTMLEKIRQAASKAGAPQLGRSVQRGSVADLTSPMKMSPKCQFSPAEVAARKRAAEIFKRSSNDPTARKRKVVESAADDQPTLSTSKFTNEQIRALLRKRSAHEDEVEHADRELELRYFQKKEVEEKVETHATTLRELKNVNVVTCKTCDYTTVHLAQRCLDSGHDYVRHKATKRFFKCKDCSSRTIAYTLMPRQPCTQCSCRDFVRVAMRDERKIREREPLLIRGEERKFVNQ